MTSKRLKWTLAAALAVTAGVAAPGRANADTARAVMAEALEKQADVDPAPPALPDRAEPVGEQPRGRAVDSPAGARASAPPGPGDPSAILAAARAFREQVLREVRAAGRALELPGAAGSAPGEPSWTPFWGRVPPRKGNPSHK
jgi:hypothetical protein